jgi:hypothetical protein
MSETTANLPCYRESNGVYFTRNAHRPDCADSDCRGCRPCNEPRHCTATKNCTWHIAEGELTCGRCINKARIDLRWVGQLAALLLPAAITDGLGSEAANLSGPSADPEAWSWRKVAALRAGADVELLEDDDEHHPHRVTGTWARMLTEDYGHDMPEQASLSWCVAYLDRTLARVAHDDEQDFPLLARELKKCRQHLEAVLHNDRKPERGAPCPECTSEANGVGPRLRRRFGHWCDDEGCERMHYDDDSEDVWRCPRNPAHEWTHEAYTRYVEDRRKAKSA